MTRLLVNADDYGLSASIDVGIRDAHDKGIVTAATWVANGSSADDAAHVAPATLDIGLHLALCDVRPLTDPTSFRGLLRPDGRFPRRHSAVFVWLLRTSGALETVAREWHAQAERYRTVFGHPPTHLDSHQHVALFPGLQHAALDVAAQHGISLVRAPVEMTSLAEVWRLPSRLPTASVLTVLAVRFRRLARARGFLTTDMFAGFRESGRLTRSALCSLLGRLPHGTVELMTHPGADNEPGGYRRADERDALCDSTVLDRIRAASVHLVGARELTSSPHLAGS